MDGTLVLPPTVTRVYVEFQPDDGSAYQLGEEIRARTEFDRAIEVTGRPQLALTIGTTKRQATYSRIWGDRFMEFLYTMQASDTDADGISISADALTLNGGAIKGADRAHDAVLTHAAADDDPVHKVDASIPPRRRWRASDSHSLPDAARPTRAARRSPSRCSLTAWRRLPDLRVLR